MIPITLSTWMRTFAISLVCSTSIPDSCFFPFVDAGIVICAQYIPTESEISKTRSAKIVSPGTRWSRSPQLSRRRMSSNMAATCVDHAHCNPTIVLVALRATRGLCAGHYSAGGPSSYARIVRGPL